MRNNPERLAWTILLTSFLVCIGLVALIPLSGRWYMVNASIAQYVTLEVQSEALGVVSAGLGRPEHVSENLDEVPERTIVTTESTALGRFVVRTPQTNHPIITTIQLYGDTEVMLEEANSPRFVTSPLPHQITLGVRMGQVRIHIPPSDDRSTVVTVNTPHGMTTLVEGSYDIKVNSTTEITVRSGQAEVNKDTQITSLVPGERIVMDDEQINDSQPVARNLITNSDFVNPLEETWFSYNKDIERDDQPVGRVQRGEIEGRSVIVIAREGIGHAETGITQTLDADISGLRSLQLHFLLRTTGNAISEHNIPVCGSEGSECPVMVRINYQDAHAVDREWIQGFYWQLDQNEEIQPNPLTCTVCTTRNEHIQVQRDAWYPYNSPDLLPQLSQDGNPPTKIEAVTIYASGHTYHSIISEVSLIGIDHQQLITRNLILENDMSRSLIENWNSYNKDIEIEGQPLGQVQTTEIDERPVVIIKREGIGHAETGISQVLDADISDLDSLKLNLLLRITDHNIPICGTNGSECPMTIRIDYKDADGIDREWIQGFYWQPNIRPNPLFCTSCATRNEHVQIKEDTWYPYLSPNLIPQLSQDGQAPTLIKSIKIYASGHTYHSMITEVELIGR
ncbi:MAG: hypothetical protein GY832_14045 [Chloroflexi bacterium]|nr:hypothetical protein [Chloroflexota bacterium]